MNIPGAFRPVLETVRRIVAKRGTLRLGILSTSDELSMLAGLTPAVWEGIIKAVMAGREKTHLPVLKKLGWREGEHFVFQALPCNLKETDRYNITALAAAMDVFSGMIQQGEIEFLYISPALQDPVQWLLQTPDSGFPFEGRLGCGVAAVALPDFPRLLYIADVRAIAEPSIEQRVAIVQKAVTAAKKSGLVDPKVSLLAAVEVPTPGIPVTMEAQEVAQRASRLTPRIQGPLSMDLSVSPHAVQKKKIGGVVPGQADILVGPNLTVSAGVYQTVVSLCGAQAGVILVGGDIPLALPAHLGEAGSALLSTLLAASQINDLSS